MADCSVLRRAPNLSGAEDGRLALPLGNAAKSTITVEFSSGTAGRVTLAFLVRRAPLPAVARPWYARQAGPADRIDRGRSLGGCCGEGCRSAGSAEGERIR